MTEMLHTRRLVMRRPNGADWPAARDFLLGVVSTSTTPRSPRLEPVEICSGASFEPEALTSMTSSSITCFFASAFPAPLGAAFFGDLEATFASGASALPPAAFAPSVSFFLAPPLHAHCA